TGLRRRGEPQRHGRAGQARRDRRRCLPPQPAQDLLHPPRRRGPGGGPVAVRDHPGPYLSRNATDAKLVADSDHAVTQPISGSMFGSAGVLPISFAYLELMGAEGLREASRAALLGANYLAAKLNDVFPVLYSGENGL